MIVIENKKDCCGCTACMATCPRKAIAMAEDEEGFLYPKVDKSLCNDCGACNKVCPVQQPIQIEALQQKAGLFQHKDPVVLGESTSGGLFTAIAQWVINKGGVVFGAAYDQNLVIRHQAVEKVADLQRFRNSKYAQSDMGNSFIRVRELLRADKWVLFSGTPCQLEGLHKYLRKEYEKLVMVDIVCHACPSPKVFRKYIEVITKGGLNETGNIKFRDKVYGYKYSQMTFYDKQNRLWYKAGIDTDVMMRAFFNNISPRPSCFECPSKKQHRVSDFTIWDCFDVGKFSKEMDNDKGVTRCLMHTSKAWEIWEDIRKYGMTKDIPVDAAVAGVREMYHSVTMNPQREAFFVDLDKMPAEACFKKYFPITLRHRIEKQVRLWSNRLGIYKLVKKIFWLLHGKGEVKR